MTLREFYEVTGGDYGDVMGRFVTEERVLRFVRKFPADGSFAALKSSLADGNAQEAFRAAHTIKGVCQNLSFSRLSDSSARLTEALRGGKGEGVASSHVAPQSCEMFCGVHPSTLAFLPPIESSVPRSSSGTIVEWRPFVRPPMSSHVRPSSRLRQRKLSLPSASIAM